MLCGLALSMSVLSAWFRWLLRDDGPGQGANWLAETVVPLGFAGIPVVGAVIAARLPANPYGWVLCWTGVAFGVADVARPLVDLAGGPGWAAFVLESWGWVTCLGLLTFVFLLFPTGRLPSPRWRRLGCVAVAGPPLLALVVLFSPNPDDLGEAAPWAVQGPAGRHVAQVLAVGIYVMFAAVLAGMASLLLRFRRAGEVERRQLAWFLYAAGVNAVLVVLNAGGVVLPPLVDAVVYGSGFALLPVAIGIAVLRYRLFEIDRIVSRTVSYGLLSAGLVALYLVVVALLRSLLDPFTGSSTLAVAGSTLAVAAAFNPARRRLQAVVDRRFDRARYDASRAVDAFAARLRDQVDLDEVTAGLRDTVSATVAPTRVAVWLRAPMGAVEGEP